MPLTRDTCLGPYEIVAPLGAGGMGEVFRARDTRLKRDQRDPGLVEVKTLAHVRSLHSDPRWDAFLKKMRLEDGELPLLA